MDFDKTIWEEGITDLCGIDEVGRGPLAGPVVAAALILEPGTEISGINDSKKLSAKKRESIVGEIKNTALDYAIGEASEAEIEQLNILQATFLAMKRAVDKLKIRPQYLLVDGRDFPRFMHRDNPQPLAGRALIGGDGLSISVAGASILAKVYRDRLMEQYAEKYPAYGFEKHKGYGTKLHREKILELGPLEIHRKKFIRRILQQSHLSRD